MISVTLKYDGSGQPAHLREVYRFKGFAFEHGKDVECPAEIAGHLVATAPKGSVKVVSGTPVPWTLVLPGQKMAMRKAAELAKAFSHDPAALLDAFSALPAAALKLTVADVEAGKGDKVLGALAVWAHLGGNADLAKACMRRVAKSA